jgi:hypothetical protein
MWCCSRALSQITGIDSLPSDAGGPARQDCRKPAADVETVAQPQLIRGFHAYWVELRRAAFIDVVVLVVLFLVHPLVGANAVLLLVVAAAAIAWQTRRARR